ncbi:unnamed protein product, partial [marine sediment metagenome]
FVTKSDNIKHLLEINPHNQAIMSFSLNADEVARKWERGAPSVDRRIEAGAKLSQAGYEVRIRIDPIVPVPDWEKHYKNLVNQLLDSFTPSRITLGSLRGLQSTINGSTDKSWLQYLNENSNWGKKVDFKTRYEMYATIMGIINLEKGLFEPSPIRESAISPVLSISGVVTSARNLLVCNSIFV